MSFICIIPARGNSKRIKNKNLKFIIYTDNVLRMNHSILTNIYELHFIKNNVIIKQIDKQSFNYIKKIDNFNF